MARKQFMVLVMFLLICHTYSKEDRKMQKVRRNIFSLNGAVDILSSAKNILREVHDVWHVLLREPSLGIDGALMRSREHELIGRVMAINRRMASLEEEVRSISGTTISTIVESFPKIVRLELQLNDLSKMVVQINLAEEQLRRYLIHGYKNMTTEETDIVDLESLDPGSDGPKRESETYQTNDNNHITYRDSSITKRDTPDSWLLERHTLQDFAKWATGHGRDSVFMILGKMHELIAPQNRGISNIGLFDILVDNSQEMTTTTCNLKQSPQQLLYNLYNTVTLADLKGYTMLQFSYMLLRLYNKGNFSVESELAKAKYQERTIEKINAVRTTMERADRAVYNCDPKSYVEGQNYVRLTKLLQGYIENEVNLNPYGTCRENCAYYYYTQYVGCFKDQFCARQTACRGRVVECRYYDSDMNICKSSDPERRYDWIEYENGRTLGTRGKCENRNLFKVDSWWRYLFWHCSYCFCLCDDQDGNSDRYFNLREVTADVENNKVVTGVRIVKNNQIIHLQIQEGKLLPRGMIDKSSLAWKPVDNYTVHDRNAENGIDFHTMNWQDRAIDIDETFGPDEHVLTGVRFRKIGAHLNLEIRTTPFNFTTGEVFSNGYSYWEGNDNTEASVEGPRRKIELRNPDIPIRNGPNMVDSKHDQYIQFQATSEDKDASQSTVPYLDSQPLTSATPLSGIGLLHRGKPGSGGFIAPKLISYNFAPHLVPLFSDN